MHFLYDLALSIVNHLIHAWFTLGCVPNNKWGRFVMGQKGVLDKARGVMAQSGPDSRPVLWVHASSYGEYNIARPIIQRLTRDGHWRVILTFFSPTGIEILRKQREVDDLLPMPLDTLANVRHFLDTVQPQKALFMVSEYWVNYLRELRKRKIPTYLVSAHLSGREPFFHWYGGLFKDALRAFTHIFVLDEGSRKRFAQIGITQVTVTGDPLFDNVMSRAAAEYHNTIVQRFVDRHSVFIGGSLHHDKDLQLVTALANRHPETRFLIVPHEISEEILYDIMRQFNGHARLYSECTEQTDFSTTQTLIIDFMGALAYLYRYARWAYVGGGFTPYLHNVLEATAYSLPVAFGPRVERKAVAQELINFDIGCTVQTHRELDAWFTALQHDENRLSRISRQAEAYMHQHLNSTDKVCSAITRT